MRGAAGVSGEAAVETVDGEIRIRQRERKKGEGEGERKRDEDPKKQDAAGESLDERAQRLWVRSSASLTHHSRAKTRIFHP